MCALRERDILEIIKVTVTSDTHSFTYITHFDYIKFNLEDNIVDEFYMSPQDFQNNYLSHQGSGFSVAPYFTQSAWFRFHNKSEIIKNLYLVGAGTHPGAGIPGVLSSAKVLERVL